VTLPLLGEELRKCYSTHVGISQPDHRSESSTPSTLARFLAPAHTADALGVAQPQDPFDCELTDPIDDLPNCADFWELYGFCAKRESVYNKLARFGEVDAGFLEFCELPEPDLGRFSFGNDYLDCLRAYNRCLTVANKALERCDSSADDWLVGCGKKCAIVCAAQFIEPYYLCVGICKAGCIAEWAGLKVGCQAAFLIQAGGCFAQFKVCIQMKGGG
jgi:hypothetical protein